MKKVLKKSFLLMALFSSILAYSNEINFLENEKTENVTNLKIENVNEGSLFLVKDSNHFILYSEMIEKSGTFTKSFDLTNLPDADYYFEIDMEDEIKIIPFKVDESIAELIKDDEYNISKPEVLVRNDHVYISKIFTGEQTWEIEVYYENYDLAYREKFKDVKNLTRVYDFSDSKKGDYTIIFSSEDRVIKNRVNIP